MHILILVGVVVLLVVAAVGFVFSRYRVTSPDEAFVITGRRGKDGTGQNIVISGAVFVFPVIQHLYRMSLATSPLKVQTEAVDSDNIRLDIKASASVKVGGTKEKVALAAQRFLRSDKGSIEDFTDRTVSGVLRSVIGEMDTRTIIGNREDLNRRVLTAAAEALGPLGLELDSLQILDITDHTGYIDALGAPRAAEVKMLAQSAEALAEQQSAEARLAAQRAVAEKQRDLAVSNATFESETQRAQAEASAAGPTQQAIADREIAEQQTQTAARKAELRTAQLKAEVSAPAAAEADRVRIKAAADKDRAIAEAEAEARTTRIKAEAQAESIKLTGAAEAEAIAAKAKAMAENPTAMRQQVLDALPGIISAATSPLASVKDIRVVSTDGASDLVKQGSNILAQVMGTLGGLGLDDLNLGALGSGSHAASTTAEAPVSGDF